MLLIRVRLGQSPLHGISWQSREAVELATLAWLDWFNHRRLLEPMGNVPPAEAEAAYYRQLNDPAMPT
ncbi:Mobile element protein [Candidatus Accumulibacter phosphatis]|uniref:Mobile element protein n=1 Tax=Candidatus Accumulibacter phosphatis TaxID=327160 RepID=A0A5S4EGP5_9PROT|nr:Mobile element protein [Candidatus Accumulibacter phosphatis]